MSGDEQTAPDCAHVAHGEEQTAPDRARLFVKEAVLTCFGGYSQRRVGPFAPGLNIVFGRNEAGKSTLASFMSQVIFGWKTFKSYDNPYEPFSGKVDSNGTVRRSSTRRREGSLVLSDGRDSWELYRGPGANDQTTVMPRSDWFWDNAFEDLTSDIDASSYDSIFNFSSFELSALEVRDNALSKLLSASAGGLVSPIVIYEQIVDELKESGSEQAKVQMAVKRLKREYEQAQEQERALQAQSTALLEVRNRRAELNGRIGDLRKRQSALESRHAELEDARRICAKLANDRVAAAGDLASLRKRDEEYRERLGGDLALTTEEARRLAMQSRLADMQEAANVYREAYGRERELSSAADRAHEALEVLEAAEGALLDDPTAGLRSALDDRMQARMRAVARHEQAKRAVEDEETVAADHRAQRDREEQTDARRASRRSLTARFRRRLIISYLILLAVAAGTAFLGWYSAAPFNYLLAAIEGLVGTIALIVALVRRADPSPDSVLLTDDEAQDAERLERACATLEHASAELDAFDEETVTWLGEKGFHRTDASLEDAREEWERSNERASLRKSAAAADRLLEGARADRRAAEVTFVKASRSFDPSVGDGRRALALSDDLSQKMPALFRKSTAIAEMNGRRNDVRQRISRLEGELAAIDARIEEQRLLWDAPIAEIPARIEELAADNAAEIDDVKRSYGELSSLSGEYREQLRAGLDESALEQAKRHTFSLQAQLREAQLRRARLAMEQQLMQRSIGLWEKDAEPALLQRADQMLRLITDGAWVHVRITPERNIVVVDAAHDTFTPAYLSTGTLQQVYLALRIAVLLTADEVGRGLPIVADDILVHFDDERREGAARALLALARDRQVIVSTSHNEVVMLLQRLDGNANIVNL